MSIITKRGDDGHTDLLFGRRIAKSSTRMAAIGAVDELNSALGVARCHGLSATSTQIIDAIQEKLIALMGQLAVLAGDEERYQAAGYAQLTAQDIAALEQLANTVELATKPAPGWARPGAGAPPASAHLDLARAIARRAERETRRLDEEDGPLPHEIMLFLNRLSDLLWLLARNECA